MNQFLDDIRLIKKRLSQICHSGLDPESNHSILMENEMLNQVYPSSFGRVQHDNNQLLRQPPKIESLFINLIFSFYRLRLI